MKIMKRPQLVELLRRIRSSPINARLIIAGSQALYGKVDSVPEVVQMSIEADLLLVREDFQARADIEDRFGMNSEFQAEVGFYAHPVGLGTITLPPGWEERLIAFGRDEGLANVWALEIHDLAVSKLMVGRDKDFEFLRSLLERSLINFPVFLERFRGLSVSAYAVAVPDRLAKLTAHLRDWKRDDLISQIKL